MQGGSVIEAQGIKLTDTTNYIEIHLDDTAICLRQSCRLYINEASVNMTSLAVSHC